MNCSECTCYVDGHSKTGRRVPSGKGLCTMYDQDVSADGNCASCVSVNESAGTRTGIKSSASTYERTTTLPSSNKTPRKGMKTWATVCYVFAAIYALIGLGVDSMLFGMTAFCGVLGVMLTVLSKSPKENPHLFGKQNGMNKSTFVIICITAAFSSFALLGGLATSANQTSRSSANNTTTVQTNHQTTSNTTATASPQTSVSSIGSFKTTEYEMLIGDAVDFTLELRPKDLTADDVEIVVSDSTVLGIRDITLTTESRKTLLTFKCTAKGEGNATLVVKAAAGEKTSNTVSFVVSIPPLVTSISNFSTSYAIQEVDDMRTITVYMKPNNLTREDFIIENSDESIINITNTAITHENDKTVLAFDVTGVGVGNASIKIKGADGKTESNELKFTINEKDTSPRVYVTPYGEKYHFSAACAGSNATATTVNKAVRSGHDRCKKCG